MSYSEQVKNYLSKIVIEQQTLIESELYGFIQSGITLVFKGHGKISLRYSTEFASIARRFFTLVKQVFSYHAEVKKIVGNQFGKNQVYDVEISDTNICFELLNYFSFADIRRGLTFSYEIDSAFTQSDEMKRAYLRGVFLSCGYIADPAKSYLVEFRINHEEYAKQVATLLTSFEIVPYTRTKKNEIIIYFKRLEEISKLLALMGAFEFMLTFEDRVAMKEMKNKLQRAVNCDTANMNKTIERSIREQQAIEKIIRVKGLSFLPEHLVQSAQLRLDSPESSLKELAETASPPVSKSTLNKRLNRIIEIADSFSE